MALEVAKTILAQLGGRQFVVMTGAKDLVGDESSLQFRVGRNAKSVNKVRVTLTPADLYKVEFFRVRKMSATLVASHDEVYAEDLQRIFTAETGLETRLF